MQEQHSHNQIEDGEFGAWKENKVTKRFFADFQAAILSLMPDIGREGESLDENARNSIQFNTSYQSFLTLSDWKPDELYEVGE